MQPQTSRQQEPPEAALARAVAGYVNDPLGFTYFAYPWGVAKGPLEDVPGPDAIQTKFLRELGQEVRKRGFNGQDPAYVVAHEGVETQSQCPASTR